MKHTILYIMLAVSLGARAVDWCYPLPGAKVISPFGGERHHGGTDLKAGARDTIYAAFAGKVTISGQHFGYGNFVLIDHMNGLTTGYSHNSQNLVVRGQWVLPGQPIAIVGCTGRSTTDHLHFEVRVRGKAIDTSRLFDHANHTLVSHTQVHRLISGK